MQVRVRVRGQFLLPSVRVDMRRRVHDALDRFEDRILRTEVTVSDVNGPRGGIDQQCKLNIIMAALPPIVIEASDESALAATTKALDRAARRVSDALNRRRDRKRARTTPMRREKRAVSTRRAAR